MTLPELLAAYPAVGVFYTAFVRFLFPVLAVDPFNINQYIFFHLYCSFICRLKVRG